jgi:hypothetical protein
MIQRSLGFVGKYEEPKGTWYAQFLFEKDNGVQFSQEFKFRQAEAPSDKQMGEVVGRFLEANRAERQAMAIESLSIQLPEVQVSQPTGRLARFALWIILKLQRWVK